MEFLFEFDESKSRLNEAKHGIDFVEAQRLWQDEMLVQVTARSLSEPRNLAIGRIEGRHWSAVVTFRGAAIRLISVRRSREKEVALYESR